MINKKYFTNTWNHTRPIKGDFEFSLTTKEGDTCINMKSVKKFNIWDDIMEPVFNIRFFYDYAWYDDVAFTTEQARKNFLKSLGANTTMIPEVTVIRKQMAENKLMRKAAHNSMKPITRHFTRED